MATPARTTKDKPKTTESDMEVIATSPDGSEMTVRLFGDRDFQFYTDVNGMLMLAMNAGNTRAAYKLLESLVVVEPNDGEDIEVARYRVSNDFIDYFGERRKFGIERTIKFLLELLEAAGNAQSESSSD